MGGENLFFISTLLSFHGRIFMFMQVGIILQI